MRESHSGVVGELSLGGKQGASQPKTVTVYMLTQSFDPPQSGADFQLQALVPELERQGVQVVVVTRRWSGLASRGLVMGAHVFRMPASGGLSVAALSYISCALFFLIRHRRRVQVIHSYGLLTPTIIGVLARLLLGVPLVVKILRGGKLGDLEELRAVRVGPTLRPGGPIAVGSPLLWIYLRVVDVYVAISAEIRRELALLGLADARMVLIPNGVDCRRFQPPDAQQRAELRRRLGWGDDPVAVYSGRLDREKGLDFLLDAWPLLLRRLPRARLMLLGDGPLRTWLEGRQVSGIHFAGLVPDPLPFLQAADCFVLPSDTEGLSNALLEAMAVGLPCVVTEIGGNVDLIRNSVEGLLVPPGDRAALAAALAASLSGDRAALRGKAARRRVVDHFSIEATAARLAELYRGLARDRMLR